MKAIKEALKKEKWYYHCYECDLVFEDAARTRAIIDLQEFSEQSIRDFLFVNHKITSALCTKCLKKKLAQIN